MMRKVIVVLFTKSAQLNMFPTRAFPNSLQPDAAVRLGRWSTRLYFLLLLITVISIALHILIRPQTLTRTFSKPNFELYSYLIEKYGENTLRCPCSSISSSYDDFVSIEPIFHQVRVRCLPQFIMFHDQFYLDMLKYFHR